MFIYTYMFKRLFYVNMFYLCITETMHLISWVFIPQIEVKFDSLYFDRERSMCQLKHKIVYVSNTGGVFLKRKKYVSNQKIRRWRSSITNCRTYRTAELGNTHHRLVVSSLRLRLKAEKSEHRPPKLDMNNLANSNTCPVYDVSILNRFDCLGQISESQ